MNLLALRPLRIHGPGRRRPGAGCDGGGSLARLLRFKKAADGLGLDQGAPTELQRLQTARPDQGVNGSSAQAERLGGVVNRGGDRGHGDRSPHMPEKPDEVRDRSDKCALIRGEQRGLRLR